MSNLPTNLHEVFKIFAQNFRPIPLEAVFNSPFQILVAVMLSARTRDETTVKICQNLFKIAPTPQKLNVLSIEELTELLRSVGFYKTKAKHLKNLTERLLHNFKGEVPQTLEGLTSLPGVGRKTANIVLGRAFNIPAIGVDTHVHRIANTLGWVKTKTPQTTEKELVKILPKKYWIKINQYFVSIGQQYRNNKQLTNFLKQNNIKL
ncbi:MAG: endonuclease III [Microgenomates group bacterium Gr01-1014_5]|nr:MAG: endonuclease III [Microgenomates group bacterium Gr01-1014_5]